MTFRATSVKILGYGSLALGVWGMVHPQSVAKMMGDDPDMARLLGARDLVVGAALLTFDGPVPVGMRVASDVQDAVRLRERSPIVALGALAVALWGAAVCCQSISIEKSDPSHRSTSGQ